MSRELTIEEYAELNNISVKDVYYKLHELKTKYIKHNGKKEIIIIVDDIINKTEEEPSINEEPNINNDYKLNISIIEILQSQLKEKDKQIERLQKTLEEKDILIKEQSFQLSQLTQQLTQIINNAISSSTQTKYLNQDNNADISTLSVVETRNKGFFSRLFKNK